MKVALDTSVLVPAVVQAHPNHARARWWFEPARRGVRRIATWHALAETWSVLTSLPLEVPVRGEEARRAVESLRARLRVVPLDEIAYGAALDRCARLDLRSGAIYDALHLVAAEREDADLLLTFNERDFRRLSVSGKPRIAVPPDPPGMP